MARYENVKVSIWSDDFADLTPLAKLLYLWSFTNPRCNMAGVYKAKVRDMIHETGIADVLSPLAELEENGYVFYDDPWLFVRSRAKHLHTTGANVTKSIRSALLDLPDGHPFVGLFMAEYRANPRVFHESYKSLPSLLKELDTKAKSLRVLGESSKTPYTDTDTDTDAVLKEKEDDPLSRIEAA